MTRLSARVRLPLAAAYVFLAVGLTGCGGGEESETIQGADGDVDCPSVISDTAMDAINWPQRPASPFAVVAHGRCERSAPAVGVITVGALDVADGAQEAYDAECARLQDTGRVDEELARAVVVGGTACAVGLDEATQTGLAELVLLTLDDQVLQVRVDAEAPVEPAVLTAGLRELVRTAQAAW
jgi:hypothetical protein